MRIILSIKPVNADVRFAAFVIRLCRIFVRLPEKRLSGAVYSLLATSVGMMLRPLFAHPSVASNVTGKGARIVTGLEALCRERGLRLTEKQRTICRAFSESGDHPDVEKILARATIMDPRISRGTVYRTMNTLRQAGVLFQHRFGDRRARYEEARVEHHHLIDTGSGEVIEFRSTEIEALHQRIARELGYKLTGLTVELYGIPDSDGC